MSRPAKRLVAFFAIASIAKKVRGLSRGAVGNHAVGAIGDREVVSTDDEFARSGPLRSHHPREGEDGDEGGGTGPNVPSVPRRGEGLREK
jgi:hypothetical protein